MFTLRFDFSDKQYTATVQKVISKQKKICYIVTAVTPYISYIPSQLMYESDKEHDQLVYHSFNPSQAKLLTVIGESIFLTCLDQHIKVHS